MTSEIHVVTYYVYILLWVLEMRNLKMEIWELSGLAQTENKKLWLGSGTELSNKEITSYRL